MKKEVDILKAKQDSAPILLHAPIQVLLRSLAQSGIVAAVEHALRYHVSRLTAASQCVGRKHGLHHSVGTAQSSMLRFGTARQLRGRVLETIDGNARSRLCNGTVKGYQTRTRGTAGWHHGSGRFSQSCVHRHDAGGGFSAGVLNIHFVFVLRYVSEINRK